MKKLLPVLTSSALLLSLAYGTVQAGSTNYNGSDCVARSGSINLDFDGAAYNNSTTTTAYVLCHVPHNDFDNWPLHTGAIDSGFVHLVDLNRTSNASCRFRGHSVNGNGTLNRYYGTTAYSIGFGTHRQQLNPGAVHEDWASNFTLACAIPRRDPVTGVTKLHVYRVNQ